MLKALYGRHHPGSRYKTTAGTALIVMTADYDFWLKKLNQFNRNYFEAEMVKAFITSIEYRQRFMP